MPVRFHNGKTVTKPYRKRLDSQLVAAKYPVMGMNQIFSSLLGNVKIIFQQLFPEKFFKYTYVQNSVASVTEHHLNDDDKLVKELPALSINMNYQVGNSTFSGDPFVHNEMITFRQAWDSPMYDHILRNFKETLFISAFSFRQEHEFEVGIHVNSDMQAINVMSYLQSKLGVINGKERKTFYNGMWLEVPLPMSLIGVLAGARKMKLDTKEDFIDFAEWLYKTSYGQIVYKKHSTSGKYLFFYRYNVNLLVTFTEISTPESNKEGKTLLNSSIKIGMKVEFNNFNSFILESYQNLPKYNLNEYVVQDTEVGITLHYAIKFKYGEEWNGRKCLFYQEFVTDTKDGLITRMDRTDFSEVVKQPLKNYIKFLLNTSDYDGFYNKIHTILLYDGVEQIRELDYDIDWRTFTLIIKDPKPNSDYKLYVYGDYEDFLEFNLVNENSTQKENILQYDIKK